MKKEDIHLYDIHRILFGEAPPMFLLETLGRTLIMYIALLTIVRWMGKRMAAQLTITEMAVMVTIGAIVSVSMQVPERGLIQGFIILLCTLAFQRGLNRLTYKYKKIEDLTQGTTGLLVKDGVLQLQEMKDSKISRQELFAIIREREVYQLGKVKRLYVEACGTFSLFKDTESKPGLSVLPVSDTALQQETQADKTKMACINCGQLADMDNNPCNNCSHTQWTAAIL